MKRIVATGTFDLIHDGHKFFLQEAKKLGDFLAVVVALDETVSSVKEQTPLHNQNERRMHVEMLGIADVVVLGYPGDKYKVIEELEPDIIALGYDQVAFTDKLREELEKRQINADIVRIAAYKPEKYKSSFLKDEGNLAKKDLS